MPFAPREVRNSCAANSPKARNATPDAVIAAPATNDPAASSPARDERERDEESEPDVRKHAVHHGSDGRHDPARRRRRDVLRASLFLLHTRVTHSEESAHQAAHEGEPGEEQEERERAVVDPVRRTTEDEDRAGGDGDAEDLPPIILLP